MSDTNEWKEVGAGTGENFDIKTAKEFEGIYVGYQENVGPNKSIIYTFKDQTGKLVSIWGSTVINRKMALVPANDEVRIEYLGEKVNEKTKRTYQDYAVYNRIPNGTAQAATEPVASEPATSSEGDLPF